MSEAVELAGGEAAVATVREPHHALEPGRDAARDRDPAARPGRRRGRPVGRRALVGRRGRLPRAVRADRPRHDRRLPPALHPSQLRDDEDRAGHLRDPRLDDDPGAGDPVGDGPPQAPRALRPGGRPALAARGLRPERLGRAEGVLPRPHGLAVPPQGDGARRPLRQGPLRRPADPAHRPDVLRLGRAELRGARSRSGTRSAAPAGSSGSRCSSGAA